ncbi:hypothetical protein SAMN05519104_6653 [Rhizobiales bacterium GAS188]|nr:hypothetical protein SAMN05519104_6653 [Rhizobiales bacterium GAS188]
MWSNIVNIATFRKGFRTFAASFVIAVGPTVLTWFANIDWTSIGISPTAGIVIGALMASLRAATNTAPGSKA